jgi:hypothetical protein
MVLKFVKGRSKMSTGTQVQTEWAPYIKDLAEMLETHLAEVNHQRELKLQHPEPLPRESLLHTTIHWKNRQASTPTPPLPTHWATTCLPLAGRQAHWPPPCKPTRLLQQAYQPLVARRPHRILSCWSHTWQKKKKKKKKKNKQNSKTLNT